jgi:hypothetical protein
MNIQIITNEDGFLAKCKGVQGGFAEGNTPYQALYNLWDVLGMISDYRGENFDRQKFEQGVEFSLPAFS